MPTKFEKKRGGGKKFPGPSFACELVQAGYIEKPKETLDVHDICAVGSCQGPHPNFWVVLYFPVASKGKMNGAEGDEKLGGYFG